MASNLPKPLFFWSLPVERSFADRCRELYPSFRVIPMHAEAVDGARAMFREDEIILPSSLFSSTDVIAMRRHALVLEEELRKVLERYREPWLRSLDTYIIRPVIYSCLRIWGLMDTLQTIVDLSAASVYPSFSRHHISFAMVLEQRVMDHALDNYCHRPPSMMGGLSGKVKRGLAMMSGAIINRFAGLFLRTVNKPPSSHHAKVDILVAGLLSTDLHAQRGLVRRLRSCYQGSITWYCYTAGKIDLSHDEHMQSGDEAEFIAVDWRALVEWRFPSAETWSRVHLSRAMEGALREVDLPDCAQDSRRMSLLACMIVDGHEPLRKTYAAVSRLFDPLNPVMMVGNCNCGAMAFAREWARDNHIPYVKPPHGFEYDVEDYYERVNEATGLLGRWLLDSVSKQYPENTGLYAAGGVHLAEQADLDARPSKTLPASKTICLLASDTIMTDYPDKDEDLYTDLISTGGKLAEKGYVLSIRCHPRSRKKWFYARVVSDAAKQGILIQLSDPRKSLREELGSVAAAMMRLSSSSAIVAMYQHVPLMGWTPRPSLGGSDKFLSGLPLHATSSDEVASLIDRICTDLDFRIDVLKKQQEYFSYIVEDPYGDPWQRSIDVILRELDKAKQRSNE